MSYRSWLTVLPLFLASVVSLAQDQVKLDSLQRQLKNASIDTIKIKVLLEISRYYFNNNYTKSIAAAQEALEIAVEKNYRKYQARASRQLGLAFYSMGDYKNAATHSFNALKFYESEKDSVGILAMCNNMGAIYDRLKDFDKALAYYFKAQDIYNTSETKFRSLFPLPTLLNNIGNIYQTKRDFHSALQYYEKALSMAEETKSKSVQGIALNNLGKLYLNDLKQPDKAIDYLLKGLKIREEIGEKAEIAKSLVFLSSFYFQQGNIKVGKDYVERAIKLANETGSLEGQMHAYYSLAELEAASAKYEQAFEAYKKFKTFSDSIQNQQATQEITRLQLQYDFEKAEQIRELEQKQTRNRYMVTIIVLGACLLVAVLLVILVRLKANQIDLKRKNLAQDVEIKNKELTTNVMYLIRKNELINNVAIRLLKIQRDIQPENHKVVQEIILDLQKEADNDTWKEFELRFNQVHSDFYITLRRLYPDLSPADEKLCAFLRLNMSSKEIAAITQQSVKSVEVARARLRKKLNLTNTTSNLVTHLSNL
jgi:tetratricopeptide (TPR) repeat protein